MSLALREPNYLIEQFMGYSRRQYLRLEFVANERRNSALSGGLSADAKVARHLAEAKALMVSGEDRAVGNYILLDHGDDEYSVYMYLQPNSARAREIA